jgi:hypothetical protein
MSIQDLGSLGEIIAAVATILTLAYLAMQIRQNNIALQHAEERAIIEDANELRAKLMEPAVADLYIRGLQAPASLDAQERFRLRMLLDHMFTTWVYMWERSREDSMGNERHIVGTLMQPGGQLYWQRARVAYPEGFVAYVEGVVRAQPPAG